MKLFTLLLCFFVSTNIVLLAQDQIITISKDTIDCKITKVSRKSIFFDITTKGVKSSGDLKLSDVVKYNVSPAAGGDFAQAEKFKPQVDFNRFRLGISGGMGYLLGSSKIAEQNFVDQGFTAKQASSYYDGLKLGKFASADLTYLLTDKIGVGIKYKVFDTSSEIEGFLDPHDGVHLIYSNIKEQVYVNFIGGSFYTQQWLDKQQKLNVTSTFSLGLATYRDEVYFLMNPVLAKGKNLGMDFDLGLEYFLSHHISVGLNLATFYASIRKIDMSTSTESNTIELDKENYENLSRLDLSFGIKLYW